MTETLLKPAYDTTADARTLKGKRAKQAHYYNRKARDLPPISVGETVRLRLPGEKRWTAGRCTGFQGPRSYLVRVGETEYRRNRRHLIRRDEPQVPELELPRQEGQPTPQTNGNAPEPEPVVEPEPETDEDPQNPGVESPQPQLRRSTRARRPPDWITPYVRS